MSTIPELPPEDIWVREDFGLGDSHVHRGYTVETAREIQLAAYRAGLEAAQKEIQSVGCNELHAGSPREDVQQAYGKGFRRAQDDIAAAIRAIDNQVS